jgi:iron complex outermembrane recepter protein
MKAFLRASCSVVAILAAPAALAQTAPADSAPTASQANAAASTDGSGDEIVVRGIRASLERAAAIKRDNTNVVDSIVADDIGKFPDRTVAAALQRVPGVQVTVGDNNEIVAPIIRGLGDILTTLDGREIFTGVGRGFAYQDLPAEALAGADVYKSSSAELIEGGVAGIIDMRLHKPFDFKGLTLAANAHGIYTRNNKDVNPTAGVLIADRWDTDAGEFGALLDLSYSRNAFDRPIAFNCDMRSGNEGPAGAAGIVAPTCVGGLNQQGIYKRRQANVALQWKPAPNLEFYANGLYTGYRAKWASIFLIDDVFGGTFSNVTKTDDCQDYYVNGAGFRPAFNRNPDGSVTYLEPYQTEHLCSAAGFTSTGHGGFTSTQAHHDRTDVIVLSGGGKWSSGALSLATDLSYQHSRVRNQNFILDTLKVGNGITTVVDGIDVNGGTLYHDTVNGLSDPANFGMSPLNQDNIKDIGKEFAAKLDGKYQIGGFLDQLQFGVRFANHQAHHQQALGGTCGTVCGTLITAVPFLPDDFMIHSDGVPTINNGLGVIAPNQKEMRDPELQDKLRAYYGLPTGWPEFTPDREFEAREKTYSGYVQAKYATPLGETMSVDGLVGVRVTKTDRFIRGAAYVTPAATPTNPTPAAVLTPYSANTSDTNWLPNASARVKFGGGLQARFNYSRAIARPDFGSLNPGLSYLISTNVLILPAGSGGNPDLKPQQSDNFDATLEYYFQNKGFVAAGAYYKNIKNRIISQSQVETINNFDYNITRPRNVGKVTLKGLEVSGQAFFDFLPGAFSGLGVMANFTLADSKVKTPGDPLYGFDIQGVSKYNYNVGALYEKGGLTSRIVYTHRSKYYDENYGGTTLRPAGETTVLNMVRPNGRLDASIGYQVTHNVTVTLDGTNITRAKYKSYYGMNIYPRDNRFDDTTYSAGVSVNF